MKYSRSLKNAFRSELKSLKPQLVYYNLSYGCVQGVKGFAAMEGPPCPAHVRLKLSEDNSSLQVTSFSNQHNHLIIKKVAVSKKPLPTPLRPTMLNDSVSIIPIDPTKSSPYYGDGSAEFVIGERFASFEHFWSKFERHKSVSNARYCVTDSKTINYYRRRVKRELEPRLIYYRLCYSCAHPRYKVFNVDGTVSVRRCPVHIRLRVSQDGSCLEVKSICKKHEHGSDVLEDVGNNKETATQPIGIPRAAHTLTKIVSKAAPTLSFQSEDLGLNPVSLECVPLDCSMKSNRDRHADACRVAVRTCAELAALVGNCDDDRVETRVQQLRLLANCWRRDKETVIMTTSPSSSPRPPSCNGYLDSEPSSPSSSYYSDFEAGPSAFVETQLGCPEV